jgi:hypothetical protein
MAEKKLRDYRAQWDALKQEAVALQGQTTKGLPPGHPKVQEQEAAIAALDASKDAIAHGVWMTVPRDLADLALLAEVVFDYFWDIATYPDLPADIEDREQREVATAYLIRGIAHVAGTEAAVAAAAPLPANENTPARAATIRLLQQWRATVPEEIAALEASNDVPPGGEPERAYREVIGRMRGLAQAAWALPVLGWPDIRLRAEIVHHALWADYYGDGVKRFEAVLAGQEAAEQLTLGIFDERAVAELVKAILWAGDTWPARAA